MNAMADTSGWNKLLNNPLFQHIETRLEYEDLNRILKVIEEDIRPNYKDFSIQNDALTIPGDIVHRETIGAQSNRIKEQLVKSLRDKEQVRVLSGGKLVWLNRFLSDDEETFQSYVLRLLDFLISRARASLSDGKSLPSFEDRANATVRDNVEEFKDEIGRVEAARKSAEQAQRAAEEAKNTAESIIPNMLTTLGVFIAIVIAVVGCYLSVLLSHYTRKAETLDMSMILLMGHVLMNIIFLLIYLISKMSVHSLACHCLEGDQMDCLKCSPDLRKKCRLRHKLWLRYPYVVVMNGTFIAAYCVLGLWYLIKRYWGTHIDQLLKNDLRYAAGVIIAAVALIVAVGIFVFLFLLRSPRRRVEVEEKKVKTKEEKKQKAEGERKNIRELHGKLMEQEKRIEILENDLQVLTEKLKEYDSERGRKENDAPV